jgi:hypothetical protein
MAPCSWNMLPWWYVYILTIIKWCVRLNYSRIYQYTSIFKLQKNASNKTAASRTQIFYVLRRLLPDAAPSADYAQIL